MSGACWLAIGRARPFILPDMARSAALNHCLWWEYGPSTRDAGPRSEGSLPSQSTDSSQGSTGGGWLPVARGSIVAHWSSSQAARRAHVWDGAPPN